MTMRRPRLLFGLAASAALLSGAVLFWPASPTPAQAQAQSPAPTAAPAMPPAIVETALAQPRQAGGESWLPASVVSRNDARLAGEVPGRLVQVAEVGTTVAAGDVLARVDEDTLRLELRDAEAVLGRRDAELGQATRQLERLNTLRSSNSVAASQVDDAQATVAIRERELAQAVVARDRANQRLRQAAIRAPFAGVVVERLAQVGEFLQAGGPVVRLVQTAQVELSARVPVALAGRLQAGMAVPVRQAGEVRDATIRAVIPAADQVSRQLELRLALDDGAWLVGSAAEVAVPQDAVGDGTGVVVPRDALVLRPEGTHVFRIDADGVAHRVPVTSGAISGELVQVEGDIAVGDQLVIRGAERLRDGQAVAVRSAPDARNDDGTRSLAMTAG